jgi:Putative prokaryotic signal transducing protein
MKSTDPEYDVERLVTVERFSSAWEAQLARACLEAEGIHAIIADEHFFRLYGALSSTLGGVRLQVHREDSGRAAELLRNRRPILYLVTEEDILPAVPDEPEEPEALVTVGRFSTPWEAHLARTLLESEGIDACVLEERLPALSLLTGEPAVMSRIEVHPEDAELALEILADVEELDEASE